MNVRRTLALGLLALSLPLVLPASLPAQAVRIPAPAESPAMVELRKELRITQAKLDLLKKENDRLRKENQPSKAAAPSPIKTPPEVTKMSPRNPRSKRSSTRTSNINTKAPTAVAIPGC